MDAEHPCSTIEVLVSRPEESGFREETKFQISDLFPNGLICNTNIQLIKTPRRIEDSALHAIIALQYSEKEVNASIKKATDNLCQEFIKSTEKTLKTIRKQKDIECNQIKK
ncbi:hypothetical protein C2G38_2047004 [Gigaspora rosea]|uniref:Uncharacterized protein n=1 Tax=Gigaspora rosea TaxID=44941 RepID=A0A397U7B5_9GLOM|nr:hypothetical protein C2G38_2047004 [Gigaspora rosea]